MNVPRKILIVVLAMLLLWVSGLRVQFVPAYFVRVVDADTGRPIPMAMALLSDKWRDYLAAPVSRTPDDFVDEHFVSGQSGWIVVRPRVRAFWAWYRSYQWKPDLRIVLHPLYIQVERKLYAQPWLPWQVVPPMIAVVRMRKLAKYSRNWARLRSAGDASLSSFSPVGPPAIFFPIHHSYFYSSNENEHTYPLHGERVRTDVFHDLSAIENEWSDACRALGLDIHGYVKLPLNQVRTELTR